MNDTSIIKSEFEKMKLIRLDIKKTFNEIETKINTLKTIYIELINTHQDNTYIFGIDSFHFQNKMIESEYIYICKNFTDIENRMYCEYYKLYKMIQEYIKTEINDPKFLNNSISTKKYPVYKDLELNKNYEFNITSDLHQTIIQTINELGEFLSKKMSKLNEDNKQYKKGIYIDNMINTINYNNAILVERINMFIHFMEAFNKHHTKYFSRLLNKSNLINDMINEDIHITNKEELSPPLSPATSTSNIINKSEDAIIDTNTENSNISFTIIDKAVNEFNNNVISNVNSATNENIATNENSAANDNSHNDNNANDNNNNDNDEVPFSV
jgi:hypothetical protein